MEERFIITLRVADRFYQLKVNRKDEQKYRYAAVAIDKKTNQYRELFEGSDSHDLRDKDYLAMTAIQAVSEYEGLEIENKDFEDGIKKLTLEIEQYLKASK